VRIVRLKIIEAKDLPVGDVLTRSSDPYCVFSFGPEIVVKTKKVRRTLSPHWNEEFAFEIGKKEKKYGMTFSVYDYDFLSQDDFLGRHVIPSIGDYIHKGEKSEEVHDLWLPLTYVRHGQETSAGSLHIQLEIHRRKDQEKEFWTSVVKTIKDEKPYDLDILQLKMLLEG
jgi:Ca2+-dependent lipid-binding protein